MLRHSGAQRYRARQRNDVVADRYFRCNRDQTYLHGTVEEAAVLARLVQQSFGGGQGQHAPRLVRLPQIAPGPPEKLDPCHLITGSAFRRADWSDGAGRDAGVRSLGPCRGDFPAVWGYVIP